MIIRCNWERPEGLDLSRLEEKFGWIREFGAALGEWNDLHAVLDCALEYGRVEGYHRAAGKQLLRLLKPISRTMPGRRLVTALVKFVRAQSQPIQAESLPARTEVLESLIGKGKRLQGQHSRGRFTKMILGMAASMVGITHDGIARALETVRNAVLLAWCQQNLGTTLTAQRHRARPATIGTKTG